MCQQNVYEKPLEIITQRFLRQVWTVVLQFSFPALVKQTTQLCNVDILPLAFPIKFRRVDMRHPWLCIQIIARGVNVRTSLAVQLPRRPSLGPSIERGGSRLLFVLRRFAVLLFKHVTHLFVRALVGGSPQRTGGVELLLACILTAVLVITVFIQDHVVRPNPRWTPFVHVLFHEGPQHSRIGAPKFVRDHVIDVVRSSHA